MTRQWALEIDWNEHDKILSSGNCQFGVPSNGDRSGWYKSSYSSVLSHYVNDFNFRHDDKPSSLTPYRHTWSDEEGYFNRIDKPAIIDKDGFFTFYQRGNIHRLGGPARGNLSIDWKEYWLYNERIDERWFTERGLDPDNLSEDEKIMITLELKPQ